MRTGPDRSAAGERGSPLVSVGIPTRDRPAGLRRTLEQITKQSYRNLEILVSDNASAGPETETVAREFESRDPRVRYYRQSRNIGLEGNFKFLVRQASGEFFFWAADDDEWSPEFVEICLAHIGDAGSVMTAMRTAVRTRGLLRPKPPLELSARRAPYDCAVAFLTNFQPSLFYGIHRREALEAFLQERMFDYYDCSFILRQILTRGFEVVQRVAFHVGVDTEEPRFQPMRPRAGAVYEYRPFLSRALASAARSSQLSLWEKARLALLLCYFTLNEFAHFEQGARPIQTALVRAINCGLGPLARLLRVPLPKPPHVLTMPEDPAAVGYMFLPPADLASESRIRFHLANARDELHAKERVIQQFGLEGEPSLRRRWMIQRRHLFRDTSVAPSAHPRQNGGESLEVLQRELGLVLLQLEDREARIQSLIRRRERRRRLAAMARLSQRSGR